VTPRCGLSRVWRPTEQYPKFTAYGKSHLLGYGAKADGLMSEIPVSWKCLKLRGAKIAWRTETIPAICTSRTFTGRPRPCSFAEISPARFAAPWSKPKTWCSNSSASVASNTSCKALFPLPSGKELRPKLISKTLTLVVHTEPVDCESNHAMTCGSGSPLISR